MHPFSVRQLILSSSPQVRESNLGLWIRTRRGFQPPTQASSRYPSYQRRLGTECDRVRGEFPDKLDRWNSEIAEEDWERGCVDSRLKVPYSGFFINGRGIPDSKSSFPDFKPRDSGFHSKNLMQSGFQEQKFPRHREGPCRVKSKSQSICAVARTGSLS